MAHAAPRTRAPNTAVPETRLQRISGELEPHHTVWRGRGPGFRELCSPTWRGWGDCTVVPSGLHTARVLRVPMGYSSTPLGADFLKVSEESSKLSRPLNLGSGWPHPTGLLENLLPGGSFSTLSGK